MSSPPARLMSRTVRSGYADHTSAQDVVALMKATNSRGYRSTGSGGAPG